MSYFDDDYGMRPSKLSYFLVAFIAAILGGIFTLFLAPYVLDDYITKQTPSPQQTEKIIISQDENATPTEIIAEKIGPTVVGITNRGIVRDFFGRTGVQEKGSGSGVIIDAKGYIVTNYHVIEDAAEVVVTLADGKQYAAEIIGSDPRTDLAVLKIKADNLPVAPLGDSDKLKVGELAVAIGNPLGIEFARSLTQGIISATERTLTIGDRQFRLIQTDAAINPGNSGGALVNKYGQVIGINSAKLVIQGVEGMGFAIPVNDAKPIINELISKGYVSRPYIGILGSVVDEFMSKKYKVPQGILVEGLTPRGPAMQAGLKEMDIISKVNGQEIKDFHELNIILDKLKPGDKVKLTIDRYGKELEIEVTLGEMPRK